jgi:hypothetical protein
MQRLFNHHHHTQHQYSNKHFRIAIPVKISSYFYINKYRHLLSDSIPANSKGQAAPFTNGYKWPRKSITLNCPKCGASVKTRVETSPTIVTVIACIILFFATVILSFVPFCIRACKRSTHYCPHCNSILGVRHELR